MRRIAYLVMISIMMPVLIGSAISCKSSPQSSLDETTVRTYADPATDTTLQGLSENNLAKYTQYGNTEFKAAVTQKILDTTAVKINDQLGAYQSKEFLRTEEQGAYIIVHYKAKYAKGDVGIRMVFDKDHLIAGQWFE
jgi:hypothetical protein